VRGRGGGTEVEAARLPALAGRRLRGSEISKMGCGLVEAWSEFRIKIGQNVLSLHEFNVNSQHLGGGAE
jgi:hypothetical protein